MTNRMVVFDEESEPARSTVELPPDMLVFDVPSPKVLQQTADSEFLIFDAPPAEVQVVSSPTDFLLVDGIPGPPVVVAQDSLEDVLIFATSGPTGPQGQPGQQGPQGQPGLAGPGAYYQTFNFASPNDTWVIEHNQGSMALSVELFDTSGEPIEANVRYVSTNVIEVDWYYPMAGEARLFR